MCIYSFIYGFEHSVPEFDWLTIIYVLPYETKLSYWEGKGLKHKSVLKSAGKWRSVTTRQRSEVKLTGNPFHSREKSPWYGPSRNLGGLRACQDLVENRKVHFPAEWEYKPGIVTRRLVTLLTDSRRISFLKEFFEFISVS